MTSETPEIVVPETSCLIALMTLDQLHLLRTFYGAVVVLRAVFREYGSPLPDWVGIERPSDTMLVSALRGVLGPGESEAIALASDTPSALLVLDDRRARREAGRIGLRYTGTIGILLRAQREGLLASIADALAAMESVGFRVSAELRDEALRLAGETDPMD